jgi:hypothetical protein
MTHLSHSQMDAKTRCFVKIIIFFIIGTDRIILNQQILITRGGFHKNLIIAREHVLRELIV